MSDDSHGIGQIGAQYDQLFAYMIELDIEKVTVLGHGQGGSDPRFPQLAGREVRVKDLLRSKFFKDFSFDDW